MIFDKLMLILMIRLLQESKEFLGTAALQRREEERCGDDDAKDDAKLQQFDFLLILQESVLSDGVEFVFRNENDRPFSS